jgi:hypothetical protein
LSTINFPETQKLIKPKLAVDSGLHGMVECFQEVIMPEKKDEQMWFRVTLADRERIEEAAEYYSMTTAEFCRMAVLHAVRNLPAIVIQPQRTQKEGA